ncbi:MAG TPA: DUF2127 domain-containing protein [Luteimonas sp.]|nr:DUF2127 domain-containing protein [Luteimonas sp.]
MTPGVGQGMRGHGGLHAIAIVEAAKGVLAVASAAGLEFAGPAVLQRWVEALIALFHFDPEHGALPWLLHGINPESVHVAAAAVCAYGILHLVEAWGLWRARAWASWLGCTAAAVYIPFEVDALLREPGWLAAGVLLVNGLVVAVLGRDLVRRRR